MTDNSKYINDIKLIVDKFNRAKDTSIPEYTSKAEKLLKFKKITDYTDDNRDFKDIMTKFVVDEFYKSDAENANFIQLITELFDNMIHTYCINNGLDKNDILFLYKGGNVLRVLAIEAMNSQPGEMKDKLMEAYEKYFKKSDADFTIYINPNIDEEQFRKIYNDLSSLTYICLNYIRAIFFSDLSGYFSYARLDSSIKKEILTTYLNKLNESSALSDPKNEYNGGKFVSLKLGNEEIGQKNTGLVNNNNKSSEELKQDFGGQSTGGRQDHLIVDDKETGELVYYTTPIINFFNKYNMLETDDEKRILKFILEPLGNTNSSSIYVSYNSTLDFALSKFNLMRSKVNFVADFQKSDGTIINKNLNGELIDVSIIDLRTLKRPGQSVHEDLSRVRNYTDTALGITMKFKSYSLRFFIHDLVFIIFENADYPWEDRKYGKRLARLFFLYLIDMMDKQYGLDIVNRITFIRVLKSSFVEVKERLNESGNFTQSMIESLKAMKQNIVQYDYLLKDIIKYVELPLKKEPQGNIEEFKKLCEGFINDVISNLNIMDLYLASLQNYVTNDGLMNQSDLYSFQQLGGMETIYYKKYLKYREKYLNLKNQLNH